MLSFLVQNNGLTTANMDILPREVNPKLTETSDRINCFDLAIDNDCTLIINGKEIKVFATDGLSTTGMIIENLIIKESGINFKLMGGVGVKYA